MVTLKDIVEAYSPKGRAVTYEEKRVVMEKILALWARMPFLRLMQLIESACSGDKFYLEDQELVKKIESFIQREEEED